MALATIDIARSFGLTEAELMEQALRHILLEKRRVAAGTVVEHPAWEDLIVVENLETSLEELDEHLRNL